MKKALIITLSVLSVAAFGAHAGLTAGKVNTQTSQTEAVIKGIANGAISMGMSASQIEKAVN
ncbi:hypothetical protein H2O73_03635 [Vibrio sp. 404]|uniref:Uncharacterized protein n=1 Tax=Vibrio marinisediminis TaxID=2758441 RepID=A0A7W2FNX7_9VIBR|nr:hypothetical protein [Vibrio marinisediminis]MBA5761427.1 hypothetical protein [Vibrio marinisediminis]